MSCARSRAAALLAGSALALSLSIAPAARAEGRALHRRVVGTDRPARAHRRAVKMGIETAVDEINEAGGVLGQKLRVIAYDDQGEPSRAVDNARRIGERDNCIVMIGGYPHAERARHPHRCSARWACPGWA